MKQIIEGYKRFIGTTYEARRELFGSLAEGQHPRALFITCSDSRVDPELITQAGPGELFVIRNAGNIVPVYGTDIGAVSATLEYAMRVLEVDSIIVCGHSGCGLMKAVLDPASVSELPAVRRWVGHAQTALAVLEAEGAPEDPHERLDRCSELNVLAQVNNLFTHPSVAARAATDKVRIYGWVFDIGSGRVRAYDPATHRFEPLERAADPSAFPHQLR